MFPLDAKSGGRVHASNMSNGIAADEEISVGTAECDGTASLSKRVCCPSDVCLSAELTCAILRWGSRLEQTARIS